MSPSCSSLLRESSATLRLGAPLVIGQLSQMLLGVVDTLMVGKLGVTPLAALTFSTALFHVPLVFGLGLLTAVSVFSANARGANRPVDARESCRNGLWLASGAGIILFLISVAIIPLHHQLGQPPEVITSARNYYLYVMFSLVPTLASFALKNHADSLNRPWPPFWIFLGGVGLNVFLNWLFIYGHWGLPRMGLDGAGLATLLARFAILGMVFLWLIKDRNLREWVPHRRWFAPCREWLGKLMKVGFPASIQMLCEVSAFSVAGLLIGRFGAESLAAHQVAITLAALSFMIPLGLSMALTVRVGEVVGSSELARLRTITLSGWLLVSGYGVIAAIGFLALGSWMASWFVEAREVIDLAARLLVIVGIIQLVDGLQVASAAMLRGMADTKFAAWMGFVAYWLIGMPCSASLAFATPLGARGIWWGLAAGLTIAAITLGRRMWKRSETVCQKKLPKRPR